LEVTPGGGFRAGVKVGCGSNVVAILTVNNKLDFKNI
jgi:hypothetical protein